jgi:hypothetical protein
MIADAVMSFTIAADCWLPVRTDSNNDLCGPPVAQERVPILPTEVMISSIRGILHRSLLGQAACPHTDAVLLSADTSTRPPRISTTLA